jgi:hypothetical protein
VVKVDPLALGGPDGSVWRAIGKGHLKMIQVVLEDERVQADMNWGATVDHLQKYAPPSGRRKVGLVNG